MQCLATTWAPAHETLLPYLQFIAAYRFFPHPPTLLIKLGKGVANCEVLALVQCLAGVGMAPSLRAPPH